ncbi:alpha/beta hydrolase family protein [Vibrio salinus]|uniref:alpha/beta hydrolase family protein n=1 Tax=Vibrio salinus TaxID=2899784 RepID=UPI001E32E235|nr:alpha/beta hydrolase [Vibrio salinus]MCE0492587.1 alpha/beta hydrolase [Vibrio salinus]
MAALVTTYQYGRSESQSGDLFLPKGGVSKGFVCLIHGGFWKYPYGKDQMNELSAHLAQMGYGVWNIEYRRTGEKEGGWPGTFDDVVDAVNYLGTLDVFNKTNISIIGHSAGGHLSLWLSHQQHRLNLAITEVIALAPVADLIGAFKKNMGNGAVYDLLGVTPSEDINRYLVTSPMELLPGNIPQYVLHGTDDEYVDINMTYSYSEKALALNSNVMFLEIEKGTHFDFLDLSSPSVGKLFDILNGLLD